MHSAYAMGRFLGSITLPYLRRGTLRRHISARASAIAVTKMSAL